MKKSELYHLTQMAVITTPCIAPETKIEILRELIDKEDLEIFCEDREAKKEGNGNAETV